MKNKKESVLVHTSPRDRIKRTNYPTDMLMSTACLDVYQALTVPQKSACRIKQIFRARDTYVDKL